MCRIIHHHCLFGSMYEGKRNWGQVGRERWRQLGEGYLKRKATVKTKKLIVFNHCINYWSTSILNRRKRTERDRRTMSVSLFEQVLLVKNSSLSWQSSLARSLGQTRTIIGILKEEICSELSFLLVDSLTTRLRDPLDNKRRRKIYSEINREREREREKGKTRFSIKTFVLPLNGKVIVIVVSISHMFVDG